MKLVSRRELCFSAVIGQQQAVEDLADLTSKSFGETLKTDVYALFWVQDALDWLSARDLHEQPKHHRATPVTTLT